MTVKILGLGTAVPKHQMTQAEATHMFTQIVCEEERQARLASVLFRKSEVETRNTVMPHQVAYNWCDDVSANENIAPPIDKAIPMAVLPQVAPGASRGPTTSERMELYARFASDLAVQASQLALTESQIPAREITHLVIVTCTGFAAPGVDIDLIERLGLSDTTQRIQVGFMGCHGAVNGLRTALALANSDPTARVLLCAIELCSLHYRFTWDTEGIIGNALFADGSGAAVIANSTALATADEAEDCWLVRDTGSIVIANSRDTMSWSIGDHGFDMRLTSDVGDKIESQLAVWLSAWLLKHNLKIEDIDYWGVHPGGPRILTAVQSSLRLSDIHLATSRKILRSHGNMSSPTVLFILNEFRKQRRESQASPCQNCVLLGFGPGLVAEIALLGVAPWSAS